MFIILILFAILNVPLFSDLLSDGASDRMSLPPDDSSIKDSDINNRTIRTSPQLESLPPPPNMYSKKSFVSSDNYFREIGNTQFTLEHDR